MTTAQKCLLELACLDEVLTWEDAAEQLKSPDWTPGGPWKYKWQDYIPSQVRKNWNDLPVEAQLMAVVCAKDAILLHIQ